MRETPKDNEIRRATAAEGSGEGRREAIGAGGNRLLEKSFSRSERRAFLLPDLCSSGTSEDVRSRSFSSSRLCSREDYSSLALDLPPDDIIPKKTEKTSQRGRGSLGRAGLSGEGLAGRGRSTTAPLDRGESAKKEATFLAGVESISAVIWRFPLANLLLFER